MKFPLKLVDITATITSGQGTTNSLDVPADLNGYIKAIYINAPSMTGASYQISIVGPKSGWSLYAKASLTPNAKTNILVDANNYPLQIPVTAGTGITITSAGTEAADRAFAISLLIDRGV